MSQNEIGEIRGIASSQNIESEMEEILEEKLKEFPDSNEYKKKVSDMRELTKIYEKYQNNQELTKENLRFLYEIDSKIEGFGYQKDPRIEEIIGKRNKRKDLAEVFGCTEKEIGIEPESIEGKEFVYYYGNLDLRNLTSAEGLILPESISGYLDLRNLTSAKGLTLPRNIGGSLFLDSLISSEDLTLPRNIRGSLFLDSLISSEYLTLPQSIGRRLYLRNLTIDDLLNTELPNSVLLYIFLKDGTYSLEELKNLIAIKRERLDLQAKRDVMQSNLNITDDNPKRGNINIWYILIPAFTLLLGIVIASLIYKF